jgi:magnesium transporter
MDERMLIDQIRSYLADGDIAALGVLLNDTHASEVALACDDLRIDEITAVLRTAHADQAADVFGRLDARHQAPVAEALTREELVSLITELQPDVQVDVLKRLPDAEYEYVLQTFARREREDIRRMVAHPEGTAGSVMTSEYVSILPTMTVAQALAAIRRDAPNKETIYYTYVVDAARRLMGFVSLKDLILAHPEARVELVMDPDVIAVPVDESQEEAAQKIRQYDLIALPVVDDAGRLAGIITYDDALDIVSEEFTEDLEKFMAISGGHEAGSYLHSTVRDQVRYRIGWVAALAVLGMVSGFIVHRYEALIVQFSILATFMPMLVDTGGNTGSQSATLVVRALALGEVEPRDGLRILAKELGVSLVLGVFLAVVAFGRVFLFGDQGTLPPGVTASLVGIAVAAALLIQVITSTLIGAFLPLIAARAKVDPAIVASPALTTIVDITGLLIFFTTARVILGI